MQDIKGFIGIDGYKKGYIVKTRFFLLEICIGKGAQHKDFERYLSIFSEIRGIL
jgi:hypothetical protein